MDYVEINQKRKSVRYFDPERQVDEETVRKIIEQAMMAPSSYNMQPWQFLVLRDPANKQKLRALAYDQSQVTDASVAVMILGYKDPSAEYIDRVFADWPAKGYMPQEAVTQTTDRLKGNFAGMTEEQKILWATRSCNLAGMNLMLAAQNFGVDSGSLEGFDYNGFVETFKIPKEYYPIMLVVLGYKTDTEAQTERKMRFGFEEKVWLDEVPAS